MPVCIRGASYDLESLLWKLVGGVETIDCMLPVWSRSSPRQHTARSERMSCDHPYVGDNSIPWFYGICTPTRSLIHSLTKAWVVTAHELHLFNWTVEAIILVRPLAKVIWIEYLTMFISYCAFLIFLQTIVFSYLHIPDQRQFRHCHTTHVEVWHRQQAWDIVYDINIVAPLIVAVFVHCYLLYTAEL